MISDILKIQEELGYGSQFLHCRTSKNKPPRN